MIGTGEYTTGYVQKLGATAAGSTAAGSDKTAGVIALTCLDLRRRGLVDQLRIAGTNGSKFPSIRTHLQRVIGDCYRDMDLSLHSYPSDSTQRDALAYRRALADMSPGDVAIVFTPDDTHFSIAMDAVAAGLHVLVAKPLVKTVAEHRDLCSAAEAANVLVAMEVHKRWDPIYLDARDRIRNLGDFSFFQSYMSQPKSQLETFRSWAGVSSDISYYLNAHHIDFHVWATSPWAIPRDVRGIASNGVAKARGLPTEDTISLVVQWENVSSGNLGCAIYTASWIAPKSDVHSQQRFSYVGQLGEVSVDQAHRGYTIATDENGYHSPNPLFMKYTPDAQGYFAGQGGYGYRSIEDFILAAISLRQGETTIENARNGLATVQDTLAVTAILEAGRQSLDEGGRVVLV